MTDREKVINGLESCVISMTKCFFNRNKMCPYASVDVCHCEQELMRDALDLLQEQEDMGKELTDAMELVHKKNARIKELTDLLKEQEAVVRCKDCKHRGNSKKCVLSAISEEKNFPLFMLDNRGEWFCADGERRADP